MIYKGKNLRHEIKYSINKSDYHQLKSRLSHLMKLDANAEQDNSYNIKSLYFDDQYNNAYYEKEDGVFQRKKYRIRIYNNSDKLIKLELKEKFDKYISKASIVITRKEYEKLLDGSFSHHDALRSDFLLKFYGEMKILRMKPRIIVDYLREPFIHKHGNVRITFDHHLKTVLNDVDLFKEGVCSYSVMDSNSLILEVKYDDYLPKYIESALSLHHHQLISASKYVLCCQAEMSLNWKEKR